MTKEMKPRWKYDCFHCELFWCCGPTCQCGPHSHEGYLNHRHPEICCFAALRIDDRRDRPAKHKDSCMEGRLKNGHFHRIIQVAGNPWLSVDQVIQYRFQGGAWRRGRIHAIGDACNKKASYKTTMDDDIPYVLKLVRVK